MSPSGSRASDDPPSSEMSSPSTYSFVSPDVMEGSSVGDILKPGKGAVFFHACSFLPIFRDLLAILAVSSSLPCAVCKIFEDLPHQYLPFCYSMQLLVPDKNIIP